jgi:hypothetical protein
VDSLYWAHDVAAAIVRGTLGAAAKRLTAELMQARGGGRFSFAKAALSEAAWLSARPWLQVKLPARRKQGRCQTSARLLAHPDAPTPLRATPQVVDRVRAQLSKLERSTLSALIVLSVHARQWGPSVRRPRASGASGRGQ